MPKMIRLLCLFGVLAAPAVVGAQKVLGELRIELGTCPTAHSASTLSAE
ncbi:MAG: hypothetical protein AAFU77_15935 [Myxococcota bacterium]